MKILYVAKHGSGGNDDEGAIAHALRTLGHSVRCVPEKDGGLFSDTPTDLLLFHKWYDVAAVLRSKARVKAFWHFDLVRSDQWSRKDWEAERVAWIETMTAAVDVGFCTDGDWVDSYARSGRAPGAARLVWLPQGADERVVGAGAKRGKDIDVLYVGSWSHGGGRASHIERLRARYGDRLRIVGGTRRTAAYGRVLADLIARSKVVVAPDSPVTDRYWSNRVYNMLGFGALLLHRYSAGLAEQYRDEEDLIFYRSRTACESWIDDVLDGRPVAGYNLGGDPDRIPASGLRRTVENHLYRHRCEELIRVVGEVL